MGDYKVVEQSGGKGALRQLSPIVRLFEMTARSSGIFPSVFVARPFPKAWRQASLPSMSRRSSNAPAVPRRVDNQEEFDGSCLQIFQQQSRAKVIGHCLSFPILGAVRRVPRRTIFENLEAVAENPPLIVAARA